MKIFTFLAVFMAFLCFSCAKKLPEKVSANTLFEQRIGNTVFKAKVAVNPSEQSRGLMGVKKLPENEGMIFASDFPHMASFWMKNTFIPLDIAFVSPEGKILQIAQMYPHNEVPVRSHSAEVLYCIEMNQGWFAKNNIRPGDMLDINLLVKSLDARRK